MKNFWCSIDFYRRWNNGPTEYFLSIDPFIEPPLPSASPSHEHTKTPTLDSGYTAQIEALL